MRDSDATLIFTLTPALTAGSRWTHTFAHRHNKPVLHIPMSAPPSAKQVRAFLASHNVRVLNVAGSRGSTAPGIADFVSTFLSELLL